MDVKQTVEHAKRIVLRLGTQYFDKSTQIFVSYLSVKYREFKFNLNMIFSFCFVKGRNMK